MYGEIVRAAINLLLLNASIIINHSDINSDSMEFSGLKHPKIVSFPAATKDEIHSDIKLS